MKLENFEEWLAIRPNHKDQEDLLPGRLTFDLKEGISLETIWFSGRKQDPSKLLVSGQTLTGWLDYQRPITLIQPWRISIAGISFGIDTPAMRERLGFVSNALIKNVFLENVEDAIFTGLEVEHPAFHAWVNPRLVHKNVPRQDL